MLRTYDAGAWFNAAFAGTPLPTLDEGLAVLARCGMGANVELKPSKGREAETGIAVGKALAETWPTDLPHPWSPAFPPPPCKHAPSGAASGPGAIGVRRAERLARAADAVETDTLHCMSRWLRERRAKGS